MKTKNLKYLLLVFVIAGFIVVLNIYQKDKETFAIPSKFEILNSKKDFLKKEYEIIDPLRTAEQFQLTRNPNETIQVMDLNRDIKIEKVLFNKNYLYLLYSINIKKEDESPLDLPYLQYERINVPSDKSYLLFPVEDLLLENLGYRPKGYVIGHRYYTSCFGYIESIDPADGNKLNKMKKIPEIILERITVTEKGKQHKLNPVALSVKYTSNNQPLAKKKLDQKIILNKQHERSIVLNEAMIWPEQQLITLTGKRIDDLLFLKSSIMFKESNRNPDKLTLPLHKKMDQKYEMDLPIVDFRPFTLSFQHAGYLSNRKIAYQLSAKKIKTFMQSAEIETIEKVLLFKKGETSYFYNGLSKDLSDNLLSLKFEVKNKGERMRDDDFSPWLYKDFSKSERKQIIDHPKDYPFLVSLRDKNDRDYAMSVEFEHANEYSIEIEQPKKDVEFIIENTPYLENISNQKHVKIAFKNKQEKNE